MTSKIDRVTAKFGGRELTFALERELIPYFELAIGEPAQVRLNKIISGFAKVREIIDVIECAAPKGLGTEISVGAASVFDVDMRRTLAQIRGHPKTFVSDVLAKNPPLKYSVLAQGILAAALHGIPAEAAHFDEDEESDDAA